MEIPVIEKNMRMKSAEKVGRHNADPTFTNHIKTDDLYLFRPAGRGCAAQDCLWGMVGYVDDEGICLESSSRDLCSFRLWHRLPRQYGRWRRATRRELSDYMYNLGVWEALRDGATQCVTADSGSE